MLPALQGAQSIKKMYYFILSHGTPETKVMSTFKKEKPVGGTDTRGASLGLLTSGILSSLQSL